MTRSNPYVGPRAFTSDDELFGRDTECAELFELLLPERIVLMYSASGAGKTSLIQAKLRPALSAEGLTVLPMLRVGIRRSHRTARRPPNPFLESLLLSLDEGWLASQGDNLDEPTGDLVQRYLDELDSKRSSEQTRHFPVLVFDQFEEVFTRDPYDDENEEARWEFFETLGRVLSYKNRWALFSMREEYIAGLDRFAGLVPTHFRNTYRLELLRRNEAREAVEGPALNQGVRFEPRAAELLVKNLSSGVCALSGEAPQQSIYVEPVHLQVVCYRLWEDLAACGALDDGEIRHENVSGLDQVADAALASYFRRAVEDAAGASGLSDRQIRNWIVKKLLVGRIRTQSREPIAARSEGNEAALESLQSSYLIRREQRGGVYWFELAHDRLVEPILRDMDDWRDAHLSDLQRQAEVWEREQRSSQFLLRGRAVLQARRWAKANEGLLAEVDRDLLRESSTRLWQRLLIPAVLIVALGTAAVMLFLNVDLRIKRYRLETEVASLQDDRNDLDAEIGNLEREKAEFEETLTGQSNELRQKREAAVLQRLVLKALSLHWQKGDDERAALVSREAHLLRTRSLKPGGTALGDVVEADRVDKLLRDIFTPERHPFFRYVQSQSSSVRSLACSRSGRWLCWSTSPDPTSTAPGSSVSDGFALFAARTTTRGGLGERAPFDREPAVAVAISPDDEYLAAIGFDGTLRVWRLGSASGSDPEPGFAAVRGAATLGFADTSSASSGSRLVVGTATGLLVFDEPGEGADWELIRKRPVTSGVRSLAFLHRGSWVAAAEVGGSTKLWRLPDLTEGLAPVVQAQKGAAEGLSETNSEENHRVLAAASVHGRELLLVASPPGSEGDGHWTVNAYDVNSHGETHPLGDPFRTSQKITSLAMDPGSDRLYAATAGGEILSLTVPTGDASSGVTMSEDPKRATALALRGHQGQINQIVGARVGKRLVLYTAGRDGDLRIWREAAADPPWRLGRSVRDLRIVEHAGRDRVVALVEDGTVESCDLTTWPCQSRSAATDQTQSKVDITDNYHLSINGDLYSSGFSKQPAKVASSTGPTFVVGKRNVWATVFARRSDWLFAGLMADRQEKILWFRNPRDSDPRVESLQNVGGKPARVLTTTCDDRELIAGTWGDASNPHARVRVWDLGRLTAGPVDLPLDRGGLSRDQEHSFVALAVSCPGNLLAAADEDNTVRIWQGPLTEARTPAFVLNRPSVARSLAFHSTGADGPILLAEGDLEGRVSLHEIIGDSLQTLEVREATTVEIGKPGSARTTKWRDSVRSLAFESDGSSLLVGTETGNVLRVPLTDGLARLACEAAERPLSVEDWKTFGDPDGTVSQAPPCPRITGAQ